MANHPLTELSPDRVLTAPSILAADFSRLGEEIVRVDAAGADMIHIDIMDAHFVPNLSMGPAVVKAVRGCTKLPLDVHLMLTHPGRYLEAFLAAGADHITVHVESEGDIAAMLDAVHEAGCSAGVTLKPGTPGDAVAPYLARSDLVLVMTVEPGFGGQSFMEAMLPKIRTIRELIDAGDRPVLLQADGGIDKQTAPLVRAAGGRVLVAGSSVFRHPLGPEVALRELCDGADDGTC